MNGCVLLSVAAVMAVLSSGAPVAAKPVHEPDTVLWNQNSNFGGSVNSQNYGSGFEEYTDAAADDFAVPSGQTWRIAEVDVTGVYFNGSGPASSELVTFYSNRKNRPYRIYRGPFTLNCTDNDGSFQCILPKRVRLQAGTWWVSLVADCNFQTCSEWNWTENTAVRGSEAVWKNPGESGKCTNFKPLHVCFGGAPADLAFDLIGTR
ncbi:MAG TPA: hypothetical protein VIY09_01260 [Rhizomicrobium sp.]